MYLVSFRSNIFHCIFAFRWSRHEESKQQHQRHEAGFAQVGHDRQQPCQQPSPGALLELQSNDDATTTTAAATTATARISTSSLWTSNAGSLDGVLGDQQQEEQPQQILTSNDQEQKKIASNCKQILLRPWPFPSFFFYYFTFKWSWFNVLLFFA